MSKNKNKRSPVETPADDAVEAAPFEVNEDGSPAGSAFVGEEATEGAPSVASSDISPVGNGGEGPSGEEPEPAPKTRTPEPEAARPRTRREQITARIEHIERDGGPIGRTQRVNENWKELRAERDRQLAEWDKEIAELRGQVTAMEKLQQAELEEVRLLKIELAKLVE